MSASAARKAEEEATVTACAIARDLQSFDLLIEDMETEMGPAWGGLEVEDALIFLEQPEARELEFIAIAIDRDDEGDLTAFAAIIRAAKAIGVKVILIAQDVSPMALHQLMRLGADDFLPYPLPEGALAQSIERVRTPALPPSSAVAAMLGKGGAKRDGVIIPVHGIAGGVGATTLAVNLAWELSEALKKDDRRVCILDLDVQFGSVGTFLDLPRKEAVFELLSDTEAMDEDSFRQALQVFNDQLHVLTAPSDAIPLDFLSKDDVNRLFDVAVSQFDFVFVDMPTALVTWTEAALNRAAVYFASLELDMRSAQNALRFIRTLKAEELPFEKVRYVLNRAPGFTDLSGKGRVKRLAESLDIEFSIQIPDGGRPVTEAGDHGLPLAQSAPKNAVRKEIQKHARSLAELVGDEAAKEG